MRSRTPTQLHASLYMSECLATKKRNDISKDSRSAKTGKFIATKEANTKKK